MVVLALGPQHKFLSRSVSTWPHHLIFTTTAFVKSCEKKSGGMCMFIMLSGCQPWQRSQISHSRVNAEEETNLIRLTRTQIRLMSQVILGIFSLSTFLTWLLPISRLYCRLVRQKKHTKGCTAVKIIHTNALAMHFTFFHFCDLVKTKNILGRRSCTLRHFGRFLTKSPYVFLSFYCRLVSPPEHNGSGKGE